MSVTVRMGDGHDLAWANERYVEVDFSPSTTADRLAIAEAEGGRIGCGRLVHWGADAVELGGIYVVPAARGHGVARRIVACLLDLAGAARVYCIPFASLAPLYATCGFRLAGPMDGEFPPAARKLRECAVRYTSHVVLMIRDPHDAR